MQQKIITMKFLLLFMFVSVALAIQDSEVTQEELAQELAREFRFDPEDSLNCVLKTEVTMVDMRYMLTVIDLPESEAKDMKSLKRAICTLVCCAQRMGLMRGGEVEVEKLLKHFRTFGMPEIIETPLRNSVGICKEQETDTCDECMAGYKFFKCVYQRMAMDM